MNEYPILPTAVVGYDDWPRCELTLCSHACSHASQLCVSSARPRFARSSARRASNLSALFASARPMSPMASSSSWDRTGRQWVASAAPALAWAGVGVPFDVVSNS